VLRTSISIKITNATTTFNIALNTISTTTSTQTVIKNENKMSARQKINKSVRLSEIVALLHETRSVDLTLAGSQWSPYSTIYADDASALAIALKENTSVTRINLCRHQIGNNGASAFADALGVNTSVTSINLSLNRIGVRGASELADALKANTSVTNVDLSHNYFTDKAPSKFVDALKVNTSLTTINLENTHIDSKRKLAFINEAIARNNRLRHLFLFDARQMLLSVRCADECGVVWPYLLNDDDKYFSISSDNVETLRAEFSAVVDERRRRAIAVVEERRRRALSEDDRRAEDRQCDVDDRDKRAAKRRRKK
jgi:Ran GTPase-activating protein (RanGAP) involved in mRNA processing and transport